MAILSNNQHISKYEIKRLIKENNYCETYRIEDENEAPFFLKIFILKNTPEKMLDENHKVVSIDYLSKLRHKNIITYVEQGTYSDEKVGECEYVITNYFSGELLADKLVREGCMSVEDAVKVMLDILDGLKYMHERSLFHNDITPRNIMLSERTGGIAELIDMSHISKYVGGSPSFDISDLDERYQSNTTFVGMYNNATDLFSVVSLFYTMLTNRVPWDVEFPEGSDRKDRIKIVKEARKTPLNLDDLKIDEGYKRIIQKGLSVNGTCKYADAELLIGDLKNPNRVNELEQPKEPEQPRQQSGSNNNVVDEEKQATEAKVDIQKGKGNGFKDIAGMNELKQMLTQKVIFILKDKEKAAKYKLLPPNGMLFYGPPGCGKSFFAEKFAEETGFNFMLVKASDLGSIYVHGSQGKIADLFKKAEESKPTIICFDEFDAFVPNRSNKGAEHQAGEVNEFLSQLNNCAQRGIFVIATSNRPDMIDPAVLRTGRIDKLVYIPMPDKEARSEMFKLHLSGRPCADIDSERLAELTDGYIASDIAYIVNDAAMGAAFNDQLITQQLLEEVIGSIHPSIGKDVANSYENLRQKMEDSDNRNKRPKIGFVQ
jgi:transitional endoplasmic reticulum ATPase